MQIYDACLDEPLTSLLNEFRTTVHADTVVVTKAAVPADEMTPAHALCAFAVALLALESVARSSWEQSACRERSIGSSLRFARDGGMKPCGNAHCSSAP